MKQTQSHLLKQIRELESSESTLNSPSLIFPWQGPQVLSPSGRTVGKGELGDDAEFFPNIAERMTDSEEKLLIDRLNNTECGHSIGVAMRLAISRYRILGLSIWLEQSQSYLNQRNANSLDSSLAANRENSEMADSITNSTDRNSEEGKVESRIRFFYL